jgi:hypothetical protein
MRLVLTDAVRKPALLRRSMVAVAAVAALGIGAPAATAATATPTYVPSGAFGSSGTANGQFTAALHVAVEPTTRNVVVADSGNGRVQVFSPAAPPAFLTSFGVGTLTTPVGIAIDQATGAVYVSDSGANQIFRFTSDGAATPTYTVDPTYLSPTLGTGSGQVGSFASPIAVDPVTHDLVVADTGNNRVDRFTSGGAPDSLFLGAASLTGTLTHPRDIAVGLSGAIFVVDADGPLFYDPGTGVGAASHVRRYTATGASDGELTGMSSANGTSPPSAVAVDPVSGRIVVATAPDFQDPDRRIYTFAGDGTLLSTFNLPQDDPAVSQGYNGQVRGLAVDGSASGRVYALIDLNDFGDPAAFSVGAVGVQVLRTTAIPGVDIGAATAVGETTAHVAAVVAAGGVTTTAHIEYSLNGTDWPRLPDHAGLTGTGEQTIEDDATGLRPNTNYSFRAVATNADYSATSSVATFRTAPRAPLVVTGPVSDLSQTGATLTGRLTPLGSQATYYFEYGESAGYGRRVPANVGGVAGNGYAPRAVTESIADLQPGTVYHYRLVGTNASGTASGADETFTTDAAGAAARGYEMVSPIDKQGVPVDNRYTGTYARPDGNAVMYATGKTVFPDGQAGPMLPRVLGSRAANAWDSQALDLPLDLLVPANELFFGTVAVSRDLNRALVVSQRKFTPDAVEGTWNLYLREPASAPFSVERLTLLASDARLDALTGNQGNYSQVGTSDDARTLAFTDGNGGTMYEASPGTGLRVVSQLPDGTVVQSNVAATIKDAHQVSQDGSRIYFEVQGGPAPGLYLRENGTTTIPISVSHRPGDPATPVRASFEAASAEGRYVIFSTEARPGLTPGAPDGATNKYRYDVDTDHLTLVATTAGQAGPTPGSIALPEAGEVYYVNGPNLYQGHGGTATPIAVLGSATDATGHSVDRMVPNSMVSPNGRYFAFVTTAPLAGYDTDGGAKCHALRLVDEGADSLSTLCKALYLYDSQDGTLTCPSCRSDGRPPTGDVGIGQPPGGGSSLNRMFARSVLDDGTVFFDTPDPLVAADSNGTRDVYSSHNGRATLISGGSQPTSATFLEATPNGNDVFFATSDRLVGQDKDDTTDLYDARVGGGIAAQSPVPGRAPCSGGQCREPATGPTTTEPPASQTTNLAPAKPRAAPKARVSILRSSFSSKSLTLTVQTSSRGRIRASGASITATSKAAAKAGTYTLKVPLSRKTRAARKARRRVKVAVKVSLTPPFAAPTTTKLTRTLGK